MILINSEFVVAAEEAQSATDLYDLLQSAIKLEHATIPPYLAAAYSLKNGINNEIRNLIVNISEEEMLHMAIVCNVLNAIGGRPNLDSPEFIPTYPGPLPMSIGGFDVGLEKFSKELVRDVFMKIESPENPIPFPEMPEMGAVATANFSTIGAFYNAIIKKIKELGDGIFTGDVNRQVVGKETAGFPPDQLFKITNVATAVPALEKIVREGEGTTSIPFDDENEPAHFYRFKEISLGRHLVKDDTAPNGFSYSGNKIEFEKTEIFDFPANSKAADYAEGSEARRKVDAFNLLYSDILRLLQKSFNGEPGQIGAAVALMPRLRTAARDVLRTEDPNTGRQCGLTFEYVPAPQ